MSYSYLALGDSYTIGEAIPYDENFPSQAVALLKANGFDFSAPKIIAKTGWTTDELVEGMNRETFLPEYDLVSLLVGVNNQYRGRSLADYAIEFESLLKTAIQLTGRKNENIFVLSIPDWGVTPFAKDRDAATIAKEIDVYNKAAEEICIQQDVVFIDITADQRIDNDKTGFLAADGLHPSGKEYSKWAKKLNDHIIKQLK